MRTAGSTGTFVYVDGQNLNRSVDSTFGRDMMDPKLPRILDAVVTGTGSSRQKTSIYMGIAPPENAEQRAKEIAFLDRLKDQGIDTFANELRRTTTGRLQEVGIDLKLAADMVSDFLLNPKASKFMIVSNDRDYDPLVQLMKHIAAQQKRPIEILNLVVGNHRGCDGTVRVELDRGLYEKHASERKAVSPSKIDRSKESGFDQVEDFTITAVRRLKADRTSALDASAHAGRSTDLVPKRSGPLAKGTGYYVDINSLRATAQAMGRPHLDISVPNLVRGIIKKTTEKVSIAYAFMSQHTQDKNLAGNIFVANIATEVKTVGIRPVTSAYAYTQTNAGFVPREKQHTTKILASVVKDILEGRVDDVVLVSDDRSLWPIAELAQKVGRFTGQQIAVTNVHFGEPAIANTHGVQLGQQEYLDRVDGLDRAAVSKESAAKILGVKSAPPLEATGRSA